jgi:hypothetical protein
MRNAWFSLSAAAFVTGLLVAGCGSSSSSHDMATDMVQLMNVGCAGYAQCMNNCFGASVTASAESCEPTCNMIAKPGANDKFIMALTCAQAHCTGDMDAMNGKCKLMASKYVNLDGTTPTKDDPSDGSNPQRACFWCLNDSLAALFNDTCKNMSSVDCNPTECQTFVSACVADTP